MKGLGSPLGPPSDGSRGVGPIPSVPRAGVRKQLILGWPGHLLELFKEGHSGLGALQGELQGSREDGEGGAGFLPFHNRTPSCLGD